MNTRDKILELLKNSKAPLTAKTISLEIKKSSADVRKILSNLAKEGKIIRAGYGKYESVNVESSKSVNVNIQSVNVNDELIKKARNEYQRKCQRKRREAIRAYHRKYYAEHIEKMRAFNRKYYALYPERQKEYQKRYWLKKALKEGIK